MQAAKVPGTVLLEPVARNTAAAMVIAALVAKPADLLLFCPSDHHIPDAAAFAQVVQQGVAAAQKGATVTFGISPTFPSTAYGYIRQGSARPDGAFNVEVFTEKPAQDKAEALLLSGSALWNAGIFLCSAQTLLSALGQHAPDILQVCQQAMQTAAQEGSFVRPQAQAFEACRLESIDYAVMEHHANVVMLPFAGAWSDVGSWGRHDPSRRPRQPSARPRLCAAGRQHLCSRAPPPGGGPGHVRPVGYRHARRRADCGQQPCRAGQASGGAIGCRPCRSISPAPQSRTPLGHL
jgi:mannose-1-phosphate guanylyltransferase/mannose-6-phosphate isomerase